MSAAQDFRSKVLKDTVVIREGDSGNEFFLLEKGQMDVFIKGRKVGTLDATRNQEFFGEVAALLGVGRTATIVATTECSILKIPSMNVEAIMSKSPTLGVKLVQSLCRKLQQSARQNAEYQNRQDLVLHSKNSDVSLRNYMKGVLSLIESVEKNPGAETAKALADYFKGTNPWGIRLGDEKMILDLKMELESVDEPSPTPEGTVGQDGQMDLPASPGTED